MTGEEKERRGPNPDDFKQILTLFSEKVPALLNNLADVLYGKDQSLKYGQAVAGFYKTLKDGGMTDEQAYELTKQYMSAMNIPGMIGQAIGKGGFKFKKRMGKEGEEDDEGSDK